MYSSFPIQCEGLPENHEAFRAAFSLDFLNDNLYTYGGYDELGQQLFILKDLKTLTPENTVERSWERVTLSKCISRAAHASFPIGSKLYVHGGYGSNKEAVEFSALSSLEEIDLNTFQTKELKYTSVVANVERRWHSSFTIGSKLFLFGGWNNGGPLGDLISLNMDDMKWETVLFENSPSPRRWHTLSSLTPERFLLYGGFDGNHSKLLNDMHILDMNKVTWTPFSCKGDKPCPRRCHSMTVLSSKSILLLGGQNEAQTTCHDAFILHTDDMSWQKVKNEGELFYMTRSHHKAVKVSEHGVVVVGGYKPRYVDPVYYLDTRTLT